jgi:tetratricopeptide (TPR) repeat protein
MQRPSFLALPTVAAVALALTAARSPAQSTRDSSRTIIVDSVRKTYGVPMSQLTAAGRGAGDDLTRTVDAEARVAMFELTSGETLAALGRLERVRSLIGQDSSAVGQPERAALHFLLAETYYRLGMLAAFRPEAEAAMAGGRTRYASVLQPQMLVEAYRAGDFARAVSIAREMPTSEANGATLVAGLAAYQAGDLTAARAAFARAAGTAGPFASYAKYMDALAQLRGDTAHAANAVASLEAAAAAATGAFADQVRLTAAQVAYEGERYDDAVRIASSVGDGSALAAPALFTRAWALYKLNHVDDAEKAFSDFVARYPRRPEHDEAQLMAAQAQLELGRSADAERVFQAVADSSAASVSMLQAQTNAAIGEVARALVANRSGDLLAAGDPAGSKAVVLEDSTTVTGVLAAVGGPESAAAGTASQVSVVATNIGARLDSIVSRAPAMVTRVLFAPASATRQPRELIARSQSLAAADAAVSVARDRLGDELDAQQREMALLARLAAMLSADSATIGGLAASYATLADSMARLDQLMAAAEARLRELLGREIEATRTLAAENARAADSLRTALAAGAGPDDRAAIDAEVATAAAYTRIAEIAASGLDKAIARHPAFIARDSVRAHDAKAKAMLAELQSSYSGSRRSVDAALAALRGGDGPGVQRARQALTDAESRRSAAENEAIAAVTAELSARATEMVASLQRSTEAAQFGVASAAFFRAIDGTRAVGGAGTVGAVRLPAPERRR